MQATKEWKISEAKIKAMESKAATRRGGGERKRGGPSQDVCNVIK